MEVHTTNDNHTRIFILPSANRENLDRIIIMGESVFEKELFLKVKKERRRVGQTKYSVSHP